MRCLTLALCCFLSFVVTAHCQGQEKKPKKAQKTTKQPPKPLTAVDAAGKKVKLSGWKFLSGTTRLPWLKSDSDFLVFREDNSTLYRKGITTFVPVESIRKIAYDPKERTLTLHIATDDKDLVIQGPAQFRGINRITIEAETDLGDLGSAAVKHRLGVKDGLRSVTFPDPKPLHRPNGKSVQITGRDDQRTKHKLFDVSPLYQVGRDIKLIPKLVFKKTVKIDFDKIRKLKNILPAKKTQASYDFKVTLPDGKTPTLTLLSDTNLLDGKTPARLLGLSGRSAAGYKLFPPHTIVEMDVLEKTSDE